MNKIILLILLIPSLLLAKSVVYVSDNIEIPIRAENSSRSNILKMSSSGEDLELLKSIDTGWTKVKTNTGVIGWIGSRYVTNTPSALSRLTKLTNNYNAQIINYKKQKEHIGKIESILKETQVKYNTLKIEQAKTDSKIEYIEQTYENSLEIEHNNQKLNNKILQLTSKIQILEKNNTYVADQNSRNWFIVGAIVFAFGIILGILLIIFFNKKNKKNYY